VNTHFKVGRSFQATVLASFIVVTTLPAWAASDDEIAQKCVVGTSAMAQNGAQISYLPGGVLQGLLSRGPNHIGFHGTWEVKNGQLHAHGVGDGGAVIEQTFSVGMDDAGKCLISGER
jgi:hypothetical protein